MDLLFRPPIKEVYSGKCKCYVAPKGTGKSTLQAVLANEYHNTAYYKELCKHELEILNNIGFSNLQVPQTLVFADTGIKLFDNELKDYINSNLLDPFSIQLPNDIDTYSIFPPCSLLSIDEPHKIWGNRASASFPERVEGWFWLTRHFDLSTNLFYQEKTGIDLKIRENLNEYNIVRNMEIKHYFWKKDNEGFRKIKRVVWELWKYYRYDDFIKGFEPVSSFDIKYANSVLKSVFNWLPPFCWFKREKRFERRQKAFEILERASYSEKEFKTFKGDPFELFETKNFAPVQYKMVLPDNKIPSLEEYKDWASKLTYNVKQGPPIKPSTLEEFKNFNDMVRVVKPELYTKNNRARSIVEREKKRLLKEKTPKI